MLSSVREEVDHRSLRSSHAALAIMPDVWRRWNHIRFQSHLILVAHEIGIRRGRDHVRVGSNHAVRSGARGIQRNLWNDSSGRYDVGQWNIVVEF